jgi:hypothetical protein
VFADNTKREDRLWELTTDASGILSEASQFYKDFLKANASLNAKLAAVYLQAGLDPPAMTTKDVMVGTTIADGVDTTSTRVQVADIVVDMDGAVAMTELAPAATLYLVDAGALTAADAGAVLASAFGVELTAGSMIGGTVGAVVVGVVGGAITTALTAFHRGAGEHRAARRDRGDEDRAGTTGLSRDRLRVMNDVVKACAAACDELLKQDLLDETSIHSLITKKAQPALKDLTKVDRTSVVIQLYHLDVGRSSWMTDG